MGKSLLAGKSSKSEPGSSDRCAGPRGNLERNGVTLDKFSIHVVDWTFLLRGTTITVIKIQTNLNDDSPSTRMMPLTNTIRIPHLQLSPEALRAVIEEFVTRDGTDNSAVEPRIQQVLRQLDLGSVELHFEQLTETCNVLPRGAIID